MNNKDHLIKPKIAPKTLLNNPRLTTLINFVTDFANRVTKLQVIKKVIKKTNIFNKLKLILKEYVAPTQANLILFFLGPIVTLVFALLGYAVIPYGPGLSLGDMELGILYMLAVSSLATYGILLAG